mmetsp:Transcript_25162/g.72622  ORF Transcript_25162/g.72622 Transcript_25162/m.72622 type:complete len:101 (+) Transcript_25162:1005-1307(+)
MSPLHADTDRNAPHGSLSTQTCLLLHTNFYTSACMPYGCERGEGEGRERERGEMWRGVLYSSSVSCVVCLCEGSICLDLRGPTCVCMGVSAGGSFLLSLL